MVERVGVDAEGLVHDALGGAGIRIPFMTDLYLKKAHYDDVSGRGSVFVPVSPSVQARVHTHVQLRGRVDDFLKLGPLIAASHA